MQSSTGNYVMLTAYHCNFVPGHPDTSGGLEGVNWELMADHTPIGSSTGLKSRFWDVQAIDGNPYSNETWIGGAVNYSALTPVTAGGGRFAAGDIVVMSGGFSGSITAKVADPDVGAIRYCSDASNNFCDPHYHFVFVRDFDANRDPIGGQGDSGGPLLEYNSSSQLNQFDGVIVAGAFGFETSGCPGINDGRQCFSRMYVSPWNLFKADLGLSVP